MNEASIHGQITELIEEEHRLRRRLSTGTADPQADRASLRNVEESLDQCWDLLRQREALRDAGESPDQAAARPVRVVEDYQQ